MGGGFKAKRFHIIIIAVGAEFHKKWKSRAIFMFLNHIAHTAARKWTEAKTMKTPEEIKKGLEACGSDECHGHHAYCPYADDFFCTTHICGDARAYIQQLENQIGELTEKVAQLETAQPK